MSAGNVWKGLKSIILVLEKVDSLAARLDATCDRLELLADRVHELKVQQAKLENEQKHVDTKLGAAAILATDRLNRELLDRVTELERTLAEIQRSPQKGRSSTGLLRNSKARTAVAAAKRKEDVRR
jgi:hypothetical protein